MKNFLLALLSVVALLAAAVIPTARPALAADGACVAAPTAGPVGTTFALTASGFDPGTPVWLYAVDPTGAAFSDPTFNAFGGGAKADSNGVVKFPFVTRFVVVNYTIDRALGDWMLVVQQLGPDKTTVHQANCQVTITSGAGQPLSGATLAVNPGTATVGTNLQVLGSGFAANEIVNLWVSPPPGCGSFAFELPNVPPYQAAAASAYSQADVKTDAQGQFTYTLPTFTFFECLGQWAISAYAPGSKAGGIAYYTLVGQTTGGGATLTVNPSASWSRGGTLVFNGSGFTPSGIASCWETRPDGTVRFIGNYTAGAAGTFAFSFVTGMDDAGLQMSYSEGPLGAYAMTCRDNATGVTGEADYTLNGLMTDP